MSNRRIWRCTIRSWPAISPASTPMRSAWKGWKMNWPPPAKRFCSRPRPWARAASATHRSWPPRSPPAFTNWRCQMAVSPLRCAPMPRAVSRLWGSIGWSSWSLPTRASPSSPLARWPPAASCHASASPSWWSAPARSPLPPWSSMR